MAGFQIQLIVTPTIRLPDALKPGTTWNCPGRVHELGFVRQNLDMVKQKLRERGVPDLLESFVSLDEDRRRLISKVDEQRGVRNKVSDQIASLKKEKKDAAKLVDEMRRLGDEIAEKEGEAKALQEQVRKIFEQLPNLPHSSV